MYFKNVLYRLTLLYFPKKPSQDIFAFKTQCIYSGGFLKDYCQKWEIRGTILTFSEKNLITLPPVDLKLILSVHKSCNYIMYAIVLHV